MNYTDNVIRRFNRFELKYLLPVDAAERFKQELAAYLIPDRCGDGVGSYAVSNLYYDSPDYRCYWEKMDGIKFRRKLRIRHYETQDELTPDTDVFVEVKQRLDRVTQKRRVLLPYRDALRLCNAREIPDCRPQDHPVVEEIMVMVWQSDLRPSGVVRYRRQAFIGTDYDIGLRVTFDTNMRYRTSDLCLDSQQRGRFFLPPELTVMEIKVDERIPYWLTEMVARHNFRLERISKYCLSLEAAERVSRSRYSQLRTGFLAIG
jgi:hypothetical protein